MPPQLLINSIAFAFAALAGAAGGWWLRGRSLRPLRSKPKEDSRKQQTSHILQSLQSAADSVRSCVEQHANCIQAIQAELHEHSSTEPAIITRLAESIVESTGLMQHQCNDIRNTVESNRREIRDFMANSEGLLFTFATLDRQQQAYHQVLASLEVLAAELVTDISGHNKRLKSISQGLEGDSAHNPADVSAAVNSILDATAEVQGHIVAAEKKLANQAEAVQMQAILTHTDLLTSLPNRRALELEMERIATHGGKGPLATLLLADVDGFALVNKEYGHQGADVILRQVASIVKKELRGRDLVARYCGDTFAILLNHTTLHDALPTAERIRKALAEAPFSNGAKPLKLTLSLGVAQLTAEELRNADLKRVMQALKAAALAGGNACYRHDGEQCHPVSSAFQARSQRSNEETFSLASLWSDSSKFAADASSAGYDNPSDLTEVSKRINAENSQQALSGRSLFAANLNRRLAEWKRGGAGVSVAVLQIDQMHGLANRFGEKGQAFLRQVVGRLLEANTREMDERTEFEDGLFAILLPGTDEANALVITDRICEQVRQCKVRMGTELWNLTASIGISHCTVASRVMDIILSAESAMHAAATEGGDCVRIGQSLVIDPSLVRPR
ncbi:MAG: diguanylate cyclase [Pirellulales bacterium]|nr:diguanylate cyclase [Pirellulales bacterium]